MQKGKTNISNNCFQVNEINFNDYTFDQLVHDATMQVDSDSAEDFVSEIEERWVKYGQYMYITEKQLKWLLEIAGTEETYNLNLSK